MKLDVYIKPTHEVVIFPMSCVGAYGVVSEDNSIILNMHFPENLIEAGLSTVKKELVATTSQGSFCYPLLKETFELPVEVMSDIVIKLQIKVSSKNFIWKTFPFILTLKEGLDESGDNVYEQVVTAAREECCSELAESLATATGDDHSGKTWDELNNTVAELPILKEEQTQALGDWELVKAAIAGCTADRHNLFRNAPVDENGTPRDYRLPYIYTPKMVWIAHDCLISTYLTEFGVDVSSAVSLGSNQGENTFSPLPNLQHLVLTGNANSPTLQNFMYANSALRYLKMDAPSEDVLKATPNYYQRAFSGCKNLETIDCELDFTGQTTFRYTFENCYKLRHLRIQPFTLSTSLDLGDCQTLHLSGSNGYDSLISVLNGITDDREFAKNITVTFSYATTDFTTDGGVWNCKVWPQNDGSYTEEEGDTMFAHPITLYEAFINKGVTIAWK